MNDENDPNHYYNRHSRRDHLSAREWLFFISAAVAGGLLAKFFG